MAKSRHAKPSQVKSVAVSAPSVKSHSNDEFNKGSNATKEQTRNEKYIKQNNKRRKISKSSERTAAAQGSDSISVPDLQEQQSDEKASTSDTERREFLRKHSIKVVDSMSQQQSAILAFSELPNDWSYAKRVLLGFQTPTPIQSMTWPYALSGRDVVGIAETGSGKTLAFAIPCIASLMKSPLSNSDILHDRQIHNNGIQALVVSPTRELAHQIFDQISHLASSTGLNASCVFGGAPKETQRDALRVANIVVGTPGRLNDFINEGSADLSNVTYLVLDEADRMLDKGFEEEVKKIIRSTHPSRQTLMFTATWGQQNIRSLGLSFMKDPVEIFIGKGDPGDLRANVQIHQNVEILEPSSKDRRLHHLIKRHRSGARSRDRILIFCLYKKEADRVERSLQSKGLDAVGIHGDMSQTQRTAALTAFKTGEKTTLVATDVAARGLDIPQVKLVINYTFPLTVEDYVHRIGRTGRAGQEGTAITFFTEHDKALSGELINVLRAAYQPVPPELLKFGTTVKRKVHDNYGAFYKDTQDMPKATKIVFD